MNVCASADWIVGCFPGLYDWVRRNVPIMRHWKRLQIGDAGFAGFDQLNRRELSFLPGGHGAFTEIRPALKAACSFVCSGEMVEPTQADFTVPKPNGFVELANTFVPVVWVAAAALLCLVAFGAAAFPWGDASPVQWVATSGIHIDFARAMAPDFVARLAVALALTGVGFRAVLSLM